VKKFLLLAHGEMDRTPEFQQAHMKWWSSIQDHVVDSGNPLSNGRKVTKEGAASDLTADMMPALGYSIVQAESIDQAMTLLADCPMDMWVYEAMPM
jgi:hypothetical protein